MSKYEITNLRRTGQLEAALTMAIQEAEANPGLMWPKLEMGWIYDAYCKQYAANGDFERFCQTFDSLIELGVLEDNKLSNTLCWRLFAMAKNVNIGQLGVPACDRLADMASALHPTKPSKEYSMLLKAMHRMYKQYGWKGYSMFLDNWGWDNFDVEDYAPFVMDDGHKVMAFVEQVYNAYTKELLVAKQTNHPEANSHIEAHIERLSALIDSHPEYQYPSQCVAKLLLSIGEKSEAREKIIPFVVRKKRDFWAWELLANASCDANERFSCYCKALSCRADNKFTGRLRYAAAQEFARMGYMAEAKRELEIVVETYRNEGWRLPEPIQDVVSSPWFSQTVAAHNNVKFYREHCGLAESVLLSGKPEMIIVITQVNNDKKMANFMSQGFKQGFFSFGKMERGLPIKCGSVLRCRMESSDDNFYTVYTASVVSSSEYDGVLVKKYSGTIRKNPAGFAIVEGTYVPAKVISGIEDGTIVEGQAIPSFDRKKGKWSWSACSVRVMSKK